MSRLQSSVTFGALIVGAASVASRLIGVLRDRLLAANFADGPQADAFLAAFRAPDFVYNILVLGAVSAGLIPVFAAAVLKKDGGENRAAGWALVSRLVFVLGIGLAALSAAGIALAHWFVPLLVPGFSPEQQELTVTLTRIMFLSPLLLGVSSVFGGVLQSYRQFLVFSLAPVFYNVGIILGIELFVPRWGVPGAAAGVIVGALAHFFSQYLACRKLGFRFGFSGRLFDGHLLKIAKMMVPRTLGVAVSQANVLIMTGLASAAGAGTISALWYANNLQSFPVGVIGVSFAVAAFPLLSELASRGDNDQLAHEVSKTTRLILFLVIPAAVLLLLLRAQIVRVILGSGEFDWDATITTADTLAYFAIGIFAQALMQLLSRVFFALQDAVTPLLIGIGTVIAERLLAGALVARGWGAPGLALAISVGTVAGCALQWVLLRHRLGTLHEKELCKGLVTVTCAAMLMAVAVQETKSIVAGAVDMQTFWGIFTQGASAGVAGIIVYLLVAWMMGNAEARQLAGVLRRRVVPAEAGVAQAAEKIEA